MKHLIVVAHPAENSFTMALMRTYAAELEKLGHTQRTFDLYRSSFDPVLGARASVSWTAALEASPLAPVPKFSST